VRTNCSTTKMYGGKGIAGEVWKSLRARSQLAARHVAKLGQARRKQQKLSPRRKRRRPFTFPTRTWKKRSATSKPPGATSIRKRKLETRPPRLSSGLLEALFKNRRRRSAKEAAEIRFNRTGTRNSGSDPRFPESHARSRPNGTAPTAASADAGEKRMPASPTAGKDNERRRCAESSSSQARQPLQVKPVFERRNRKQGENRVRDLHLSERKR